MSNETTSTEREAALLAEIERLERMWGKERDRATSALEEVMHLSERAEKAEAERDAAREALADCNAENTYLRSERARVEALAKEWECASYTAMSTSHRAMCPDCARADRLRAALRPATDEGAGA